MSRTACDISVSITPGATAVDADLARRELDRQRARERVDRALARRVVRLAAAALLAGDRAQVDDRARRAATIMYGATARVTLNTPPTLVSSTTSTSSSSTSPPAGCRGSMPALLTRMSMRPARSAIASTAAAQARRIADVDLHRRDLAARRLRPAATTSSRGRRVAAIEERDVDAFGGEQLDDRAADAAAAAGHQRDLAASPDRELHVIPRCAKPPSTTSVCPLIIAASGRHSR